MRVVGTRRGAGLAPKLMLPSDTLDTMTERPNCILAFDIGIRNLAWCLMEAPVAGAGPRILGWQNYDLLAGAGHEAPKQKLTCGRCAATATFQASPAAATCLRHCPPDYPPLKDLSGGVLKRIPAVGQLRAIAAAAGITGLKKTASKAVVLAALAQRVSLPIEKPKLKKAVEHELTLIHEAIRTFVQENAQLFRQSTQILLENQPVLKNPTMKTVQILLFATLRDLLQPGPPPVKLVHAGKKVAGKTKGDAGYKSRKDASEEKVIGLLKAGKVVEGAPWLGRFEAAAKKSDLADAFCMCWDAHGLSVDDGGGVNTSGVGSTAV